MDAIRNIAMNALNSWVTTIALGVPGGAQLWATFSAMIDGDDATTWTVTGLITGIGLVIGGFMARDGNKSSEDVGVK